MLLTTRSPDGRYYCVSATRRGRPFESLGDGVDDVITVVIAAALTPIAAGTWSGFAD